MQEEHEKSIKIHDVSHNDLEIVQNETENTAVMGHKVKINFVFAVENFQKKSKTLFAIPVLSC